MTDWYLEYFLMTYLCVSFLTYYIIPDYNDIINDFLSKISSFGTIVAFPYVDGIDNDNNNNDSNNVEVKEEKKDKKEVKFEDKYKEEFAKMSSEQLPFTTEELESISKKTFEFIQKYNDHLDKEINDVKSMLEDDSDNDNNDNNDKNNNKEKLEELLEEKSLPYEDTYLKAEEEAKKEVLNDRLKRLKKCYVFEKTPLGNVAMCYNFDKDSFEYYSDNTLPYRFLEPVGRKYVLTFKCKHIFVDMVEELKEAELRADKKKLEEEDKAKKEKESGVRKRNVFAKLKEYNSPTSSGAKGASVGAKTNNIKMPANIKANLKDINTEPEKLLLKEKSNHYTCQGKFANMKVLQPVNRKLVDKKYAMSFADFKKMSLKK